MWWRLDLFGMWDGVPIGYRYGFAILVLGGIVLLIGAALKELEWCRPHGDSRTQTDDKRTGSRLCCAGPRHGATIPTT
jgi:hypothetical protein